ncbi:low temperature requirement protein A [Asanoa sp. NPDC049518]|uniref:low temperature requirement protein A n=1 Tax=unclassified Asanoa TaxID=2685164 RepID=UPI003415E4E5
MELFFDLVVVVAVAQLAHQIEGDPSLLDAGLFVVLFYAGPLLAGPAHCSSPPWPASVCWSACGGSPSSTAPWLCPGSVSTASRPGWGCRPTSR